MRGSASWLKHQRYAHAHQFKRANRSLRKLKTYLGRVVRDIERRIVWNEDLREAFIRPLFLARRVLEQERRQRGHKVRSLHAPEVECIGKGKAHRPYEFGVKVSVATTVKHSAGGQFVTHAAALPGNPYDGHTLGTVIPQMQALIGNILDRCITDAGYRGHNAPPDHKFKVYTSGQKRRLTPQIKREFKRRAAIEPVIGHLKVHHRMGRNHLAHASGDAAVLAAAGYKLRRLLAWLRFLLLRILMALSLPAQPKFV
jgi:transposase, IS5 family